MTVAGKVEAGGTRLGRTARIRSRDLPFACPPPSAPKWSLHPRVFIQISASQPEKRCPYCGTLYVLRDDEDGDGGGGGR